mgnify:CR=1 FL=1
MPKKKFSETKVGKFLKGAAPKLLNIIGDVFPSVGILSKAKDLIQKDTNISKEDIFFFILCYRLVSRIFFRFYYRLVIFNYSSLFWF